MNTPVSFEIAKMLKEKGFTSVFTAFSNKYYNSLGEYKIVSYDVKIENNEYEAPTIADVVMWLYEKYGLHVEILLAEDNPWDKFYYRILKVGQYFTLSHDGTHRNSPTEAYEAAIEYALKNLINELI